MYPAKHSERRDVPNGERGFTMIEIVVVLAVIALLSAILSPMIVKYVRDARVARAQADVKTIGVAIQRFEGDLGRLPMFATSTNMREGDATVSLLTGPGAIPNATDTKWTGDTADCGKGSTCVTDTLSNQLLANLPGTSGTPYPTTPSAGVPLIWKGPYLDRVETDPWGNQYLVNIGTGLSGGTSATFILSAGPNGNVETSFLNTRSSFVTPSGDDIIYRIR